MHTERTKEMYIIVASKTIEEYNLDLSTERNCANLVDFPNENTICELFVELYWLETCDSNARVELNMISIGDWNSKSVTQRSFK